MRNSLMTIGGGATGDGEGDEVGLGDGAGDGLPAGEGEGEVEGLGEGDGKTVGVGLGDGAETTTVAAADRTRLADAVMTAVP